GSSHVTNVSQLDVKDFSSWKDRFLVYLDGLEPYLLKLLINGSNVLKFPASTPEYVLVKTQKQWSPEYKGLKTKQKRYEEGSGRTRVVRRLVDRDILQLATMVHALG
ncbi:hypothetical protein Tco_1542786, partial [Tanacetum coccineum]